VIGLTVCSGIGAPEFSAPWIDWKYQSEIEKFPSAVLAERFPRATNLGDMTQWEDWKIDEPVDIFCGGTPCQSFSVAGLRKGLADPRGNLMLTYLAIAGHYRPRWLVWENVPGVLSANGGRDFGSFLGALGKLGYGYAYRVLDAQYVRTQSHPWAVPQRRRRVFVVGYIGDWRRAAAVLFDTESLRGDSPPRREARERVAATISARTKGGGGLGTDFDLDGGLITFDRQSSGECGTAPVASTISSRDYKGVSDIIAFAADAAGDTNLGLSDDPVSPTLVANQKHAVAFNTTQITSPQNFSNPQLGDPCHPLAAEAHAPAVALPYAVRRLTPRECERLMGFPDDWTKIAWRGKAPENCPDGPRYKALGNSWAVNCGEFVFDRLRRVEEAID